MSEPTKCPNCGHVIDDDNHADSCEECGLDGCDDCFPFGLCDDCDDDLESDDEDDE